MIEISNTGERILPDKETPLMIARHFCAYRFVKDYVCDKRVLDIGCGEGYGSYYLAGFAKNITGLDYDGAIIDYATHKYRKENLRFCVMDVKDLSRLSDKFDVICSFQFIEHIPGAPEFLEKAKSLLKENGIFICSTPNRNDATPRGDSPLNKFHVKEYFWDEFKELLEVHFKEVDIFGLKRGRKLNLYRRLKKTGLLNFLPENINPVEKFYGRINWANFIIGKDKPDMALDFIAVCRD